MNDIGWAVEMMNMNHRVTRRGWNGKNMWVAIHTPGGNGDMTLPYVFMKTADRQFVPWLCSQTDLLASDWELYQ